MTEVADEACPTCGAPSRFVQEGTASGQRYFHCLAHGQWRKKNPAAVALGSLGGQESVRRLTPEQLSKHREKAANSRWKAEKLKRRKANASK